MSQKFYENNYLIYYLYFIIWFTITFTFDPLCNYLFIILQKTKGEEYRTAVGLSRVFFPQYYNFLLYQLL